MSEENIELVRAIYERWKMGDFSSVDWADPEIAFIGVGTLDPRIYHGREEMAASWSEWLSAFEGFRVGATTFHAAGDQVVGINEFGGSGHTSGVPIQDRGAARFRIRDRKVVELALYMDPERALKDAGIEP